MFADMLQEFGQPHRALAEYAVALRLSPNLFMVNQCCPKKVGALRRNCLTESK
jgi:hypothetical protein